MPLSHGYSPNGDGRGCPPITDLEEVFSVKGRRHFQTGNAFEVDFIQKLEVVFEKETSQYEDEQLKEVYYFLIILAKRIQLRLRGVR
jgi:hypothetical protein